MEAAKRHRTECETMRNPMQAPVVARSMGGEHLLKQRLQGRHLQGHLYLPL
jgi:hypothetical protein